MELSFDGSWAGPASIFGSSLCVGSIYEPLDGLAQCGTGSCVFGNQSLIPISSEGIGVYLFGGWRFFACSHGEQCLAPIPSIEIDLAKLPPCLLNTTILLLVAQDERVSLQSEEQVVNAWNAIKRDLQPVIRQEKGVFGSLVGRLCFGDVKEPAVAHLPDGMMHGYEIKIWPPHDCPTGDRLATAFLDYAGHVPIAVAEWSRTAGALYISEQGVGIYLSCKLLRALIVDWWCHLRRPN